MTTEEKIIARALEMFNERGIEYVGLRELAATLGIRVSNISYYFPTKDDLVNRLSVDLNHLNNQILVEREDLTMRAFLEMFRKVFQHHVQYRCLLLSVVHVMEQNKAVSERYKQTQRNRNAVLRANLLSLRKSGYLTAEADNEVDFLASILVLVIRFWISEATISFRHLSVNEQISHYTTLLSRFLLPYASAEGKREILDFLDTV